jgi:hypothetical protein
MSTEPRAQARRPNAARLHLPVAMFPGALVVAIVLTSAAAVAQPGDPLKSTACREAITALQGHESEARAARSAQPPADRARQRDAIERLRAARKRAAQVCLRGSGDPPPPSSVAPPPVAVPPVAITPPAQPPLPPASAPAAAAVPAPAPPPRPQPPPIVTSCDAAGCWTSDGKWLPRAGPTLLGPRGPCTVQGVLLNCP